MISICRYTSTKQDEWDEFVKVSKNGTFLFLRAYMDYHSDRFQDHSMMYYSEKGKLIALLPANGPSKFPLKGEFTHGEADIALASSPFKGDKRGSFYSHQGLTYGGFILAPKIHMAEVEELFSTTLSYLRENGFKEWHYKQIPHIYHLLPSQEEDYCLWLHKATLEACNMMTAIDFTSPMDDICSSRKRTYHKKLNRQGYSITIDAEISDFWPILENNLMERFHSHPVHTLEEIELLKKRFPQNIVCCVVRNPEGIKVAGTVLFITTNVVRTQYISATQEGKSTNALDFLMLSLIDYYKKQPQYHYFEFGTSMAEDGINLNEGLILQKEGFGGRAIACKTYKITL